jgi:DNA-binding IclR family transcriptional regulator
MSSQPNHSLIDGLACLEALALAGEPVGCRELARRLELHPVRANRLLKSLAEAGFARQDGQRRYLPGPGFHVLAAVATHGSGLLRRALPHLDHLLKESGAVVALGVLWRDRVCYLFHGDARTPTAAALGRTLLYPAVDSSIGQVLLAAGGAKERRPALAGLAPGARAALERDLAAVRSRGHSCLVHTGAHGARHHSIAVPVDDPPLAGLACTGLPLDRPVEPVVRLLAATAALIVHGGAAHAAGA